DDEFVHTPDYYVPTDDENHANEENGDEEMTHAENVNDEHDEVSQEDTALAITISPPISPFIFLQQQSTPIPTPIAIVATTSTTDVPDSKTLSTIHLRVSDLEKEVKELKNVDHSLALRATIKSEFLAAVKEYIGTSLDDALYK
nr:hypothetical protein [Tanacetum cinerariifolium]